MSLKRYHEFDGLRGLLALWVALAHLVCWCGYGHLANGGHVSKLWLYFTEADPAAQAFIILSGFAIATLLQREQVGYGRYMLRRAFRIFPVYLVALGLSIWLAPLTGQLINSLPWSNDFYMGWQRTAQVNQDANWSGNVWAHVFMVHGVLPKSVVAGVSATFLMPAWSIGLEEQFYLVAPLLLWLLRRSWGLMSLFVVALAGQVFQAWFSNPINCSLPYWLPFFLVGIGSSYVATWLEKNELAQVKGGGAILFAGLIAALFLAREPLPFLIWAGACAAALGLWKGFAPRIGAVIGWVLGNRASRWVGEMSYSLYLIHWPLTILLLSLLRQYRPGIPQREVLIWMLATGLPVILVLSWALHQALEKPFMRLGRYLARVPGSAPASAVPVAMAAPESTPEPMPVLPQIF